MNLDAIAARIEPSDDERARIASTVERLLGMLDAALQDQAPDAEPTIQGSIAKDTYTAGAGDIDVFLLFPVGTDEQVLHDVTMRVADQVLDGPRRRYAQHPYALGHFEGMEVDLVPAYRVPDATHKMSPVDRTPFHTQWVQTHLDAAKRRDVRLAKQWLKGIGCYGAETAIGGLSGYLVEVLVHVLGSFERLVAWAADPQRAMRLTVDDDAVDDDVSPLIVVDPVDASRNCAAAVQPATLARLQEAAVAYQQDPADRFFFPMGPRSESPATLADALQGQGATWLGWCLTDVPDRLDIVYPQFQKACDRIAGALAGAGFRVRRHHTWTNDEMVCMQWLLDEAPLPATRVHRGPPPGTGGNAERFRKKWESHPDVAGPVHELDGRLAVEVVVRERRPSAWLRSHLAPLPLGKHVEASRQTAVLLDDPGAVVPPWSPIVADFILDRRPWQR